MKKILLFFYLICPLTGFSQSPNDTQKTYHFENINQENGLSQGTGYAATQYDGFLWFATQDGLNRYDGYDFKVYRHGGKKSLNDNFLQTLLTDSKHRLWVGTNGGLNIYDKKNDNFLTPDEYFDTKHILSTVSIEKLIEDKNGNIWVMTDEKGVFCINTSTKQIKTYLKDNNTFYDFNLAPNGILWLSSYSEVYYFDENSQDFKPLHVKEKLNITSTLLVQAIVTDSDNNLWVSAYQKGVYRLYNPLGKSYFDYFRAGNGDKNISDTEVRSMFKGKEGLIWVGTKSGGISLYNPILKTFTHIKKIEGNTRSLGEDFVMSMYQDQQGIMWFGLGSSGFSKYDPLKFSFETIQHEKGSIKTTIENDMILAIHGNTDGLYFGTNKGGLSYFSYKTNRFTNYLLNPKDSKSIISNEVCHIYSTDDRYLWLATTVGICRFDKEKQTFRPYSQVHEKSQPYYVYAILQTSFNEIWAGGQNGLERLDLKTERWKNKENELATRSFSNYTIRLFHEVAFKRIWVGTLGHGLILYDPKNQKTVQIDGINCSNIRSFLEDGTTLWVGTDCGLFSMDLATLKVKNFISSKHKDPAFRLINDVVYGVLKDENGHLWLSTNAGITQLSLQNGIIKNYDVKDGLQSNEFNTNCVFKRNDSTLFFGGVKGINYFKVNQIRKNTFVPPLKITKIKVIDSLYAPNQSHLQLKHDQNFIEFEFASLNFSNTQKNQYQYQLLGVDENWVMAGTKRFANYTKLSPGNYTFLVKGSNSDGIWNNNPVAIAIAIIPPWWGYWWFWPSVWLILFLLFGLVYYWYVSYELRNKQKMQRVRNQIAADLHDEVGSTLSSIAISSHYIQEKLQDASPDVRETLRQIKVDSDETISTIRDTVWALNSENDTLEKIIEKTRSFAFQVLSPLEVAVQFQNNITFNKSTIVGVEQRKNLFLIIKETINNIAKYAEAIEVSILFEQQQAAIYIEIKDNGKGFDIQKIDEGNGLKNIRKRAAESSFGLTIDSKEGKGTTIAIQMSGFYPN